MYSLQLLEISLTSKYPKGVFEEIITNVKQGKENGAEP